MSPHSSGPVASRSLHTMLFLVLYKNERAVHLDVGVEAFSEEHLGLFLWHVGLHLADLHKHRKYWLTAVRSIGFLRSSCGDSTASDNR